MATCPFCKQEINYLNQYTSWEKQVKFFSETEQLLVDEYINDYFDEDYECPECSGFITSSMEKAENFLKGGK